MPITIEEKKRRKAISNRLYFQKLRQSDRYDNYLTTKKKAHSTKKLNEKIELSIDLLIKEVDNIDEVQKEKLKKLLFECKEM